MTNPQPSQQKGVASDPRHGKARGEVIKGGSGASPIRQVGLVVVVLVVVIGAFLMAGVLLSGDDGGSSAARYVAYGVVGLIAVLVVFWLVRRRATRQSLDEALRSRRSQ